MTKTEDQKRTLTPKMSAYLEGRAAGRSGCSREVPKKWTAYAAEWNYGHDVGSGKLR